MMSGQSPYPGLNPPMPRGPRGQSQPAQDIMMNNMGQSNPATAGQADPCLAEDPNYPKIGEDHPEGRPKTGQPPGTGANPGNPDNPLDFGWFSMPMSGSQDAQGRAQSRQNGAGEGLPRSASRSNQSTSGYPMGPQCAGPAEETMDSNEGGAGYPPNYGGPSSAQFDQMVMGACPGQAGYEPQQAVADTFNWPLSSVGRSQVRPSEPPGTGEVRQRNVNRPPSEQSGIPSTPVPPLSFENYGDSQRPTYSNWREFWHKTQAQQDRKTQPQFYNTNNSSHATSTYYPDPYDNAMPDTEETGLDNVAVDDGTGNDVNNNRLAINEAASGCVLRLENLETRASLRDAHIRSLNSESYVPSTVTEWQEDGAEKAQTEAQAGPKGTGSILSSLRSQFQAVMSSLRCWPRRMRSFTTTGSLNPYRRFCDTLEKERVSESTD